MVQEGAHKYEFGDQGSILVIADDEEATDHVHYSYDGGATWLVFGSCFGIRLIPIGINSISASRCAHCC